jgi:predicted RNase H-like HicB family nuclease
MIGLLEAMALIAKNRPELDTSLHVERNRSIKTRSNGTWTASVVRGDSVIVARASGSSPESAMANLTEILHEYLTAAC